LQEVGCASLKEVCYFAAVTRAVVDKVVASGAAEYYQQEVYRNPYAGARGQGQEEKILLSPSQQAVYEQLLALIGQGGYSASLLYGVTGSGKTQIFLKLIEAVLEAGWQVIVMVPEISLTPQTLDKFHAQFGSRVAVLHSGLSLGERMDEYKRIRAARRILWWAPAQQSSRRSRTSGSSSSTRSRSTPINPSRRPGSTRGRWQPSAAGITARRCC
jgi:primosomal protein N' (replication factor Y)